MLLLLSLLVLLVLLVLLLLLLLLLLLFNRFAHSAWPHPLGCGWLGRLLCPCCLFILPTQSINQFNQEPNQLSNPTNQANQANQPTQPTNQPDNVGNQCKDSKSTTFFLKMKPWGIQNEAQRHPKWEPKSRKMWSGANNAPKELQKWVLVNVPHPLGRIFGSPRVPQNRPKMVL